MSEPTRRAFLRDSGAAVTAVVALESGRLIAKGPASERVRGGIMGTGRVAARAYRQPSGGERLHAVDEQPKVRLIHSHGTSVRPSGGPLRPANGVRSIGPLAARD